MGNAISGISSGVPAVEVAKKVASADQATFGQSLADALSAVQRANGEAEQKVRDLLTGKGEDIHSTMIAVEKADMAFELMMQVRNKIMQAYEDISRMQF